MKTLFRSLLAIAVMLAAAYATAPLWIASVVATRLPPGWELLHMESGYPGLSGIPIETLGVKAELSMAELDVSASDVYLEYRTRKTSIGVLRLVVSLAAAPGEERQRLTLEELALPVIDVSGELPELAVRELHLGLRHGLAGSLPDPILLELHAFGLKPLADGAWRFDTGLRPEGATADSGRLSMRASSGNFSSDFRFPAEPASPPWLTLALDQSASESGISTQIDMSFDANGGWRDFLGALGAPAFSGHPPPLAGKVWARARFSGRQLQAFEQLGVSMQGLQAELETGTAAADLELLATLEGPDVNLVLLEPGQIRYQGQAESINGLLKQMLPEFDLAPQVDAVITANFEQGATLTVRPGDEPRLLLKGGASIGLESEIRNVRVDARQCELEIAGLQPPLGSAAELEIDWEENAPLTARLEGKTLQAQSFSLSSKGTARLGGQGVEYEQAGTLELQSPDILLAGDETSPPMNVNAQRITAEFALATVGGTSTSNGKALITQARVDQPSTTSETVELAWRNFDLDRMAGQLAVRTKGFATEIEGQRWQGFELDSHFSMDEQATLEGTATLTVKNGAELPLSFTGSTVTGHWDVTVRPTAIPWDRLAPTLRAGQFPLPEGVKMTAGEVAVHGQVTLAENVAASLSSTGSGLGAAVLENTADGIGFELAVTLADSLSANGPLSIDTAVLAGGVKVSGFNADLEFENADNLTLRNVAANVFGGTLNTARLHFTTDGIEDTEINLTRIDLARLLAFLDIAGLQGTGELGFLLPLGSDKDGIHVRGGTFQAAGPGFLSYRKEGVAAGNIGLQALENFHYKSLSGTLAYQSKGAYQVGIRLEGKNPDLYGGHPIVFRLNINGVMPALFEAMFMTGDFEESILKEIRTQKEQ